MESMQVADLGNIDWGALVDKGATLGLDFGVKIITAILIFYIGRMISRMVANGIRKVMQTREIDKILESFVSSMTYWLLMTFVIIAAISQLGIQTAQFIAVIGAAGLAVGLALQGSLANFAAGVLIVLFRPYRVGDWVEAAGIAGTVSDVQILTTVFKTGDNKKIIVPNGQVMNSIITNYSANETRRVDMTFGVAYDDDIDKVKAVLREVIESDERVLKDPAPVIALSALADSSVNFIARPWVATSDYWGVYWDLHEAVKKRFDKEGISIPFPQRDVHLYKHDDD